MSQRARRVLPGGVTHDVRRAAPFPLAVARAEGARKWDLDGHEIICYVMGHGALLLGHGDPEVVAAVRHQATLAFHPGAGHELECEWAELVTDLVPRGRHRHGSPTPGAAADLTGFELRGGGWLLPDGAGENEVVETLVVPRLVVRAGKVHRIEPVIPGSP